MDQQKSLVELSSFVCLFVQIIIINFTLNVKWLTLKEKFSN